MRGTSLNVGPERHRRADDRIGIAGQDVRPAAPIFTSRSLAGEHWIVDVIVDHARAVREASDAIGGDFLRRTRRIAVAPLAGFAIDGEFENNL